MVGSWVSFIIYFTIYVDIQGIFVLIRFSTASIVGHGKLSTVYKIAYIDRSFAKAQVIGFKACASCLCHLVGG